MKFAEVISGIARRSGLGLAPAASDKGTVTFFFSDVEIRLTPIENNQLVLMETVVCQLPSVGTAAFMAELLRYNARAVPAVGGSFGVDEEGTVIVRQLFSLALVDDAMFCEYLPEHLGHVQSWRMAALQAERAHTRKTSEPEPPISCGEDLAIFIP